MLTKPFEIPRKQLKAAGLHQTNPIHYQLTPDELVTDTLMNHQGRLNDTGALVIQTGKFTGRSPRDKFIVKDELTAATIDWGNFNNPLEEKYFDRILEDVRAYLNERKELWVRDAYACAAREYRLNIRIVNELPWMNLFAHHLFLRPSEAALECFEPEWHILSAPGLELDPVRCGTRQGNATVISFKHKTILIAGSSYTGEIKKGIFSVLNYLLPQNRDVLSMHCSANIGAAGDTALFFGLSGTGKTTLSTDPGRRLIGDDEHGWDDHQVFNFEGGCYAKCIHLSEEKEPEIYHAVKDGALVENVTFLPGTDQINFDDASVTENTRVSYPIHFLENIVPEETGRVPGNIFFLTCDAYGVLPPVARLTQEQALYYFISGYTAKVAGTETGITEPRATFSACFGAPFIPLHPGRYASMLGSRIALHGVKVWMVNTGWTGGAYGTGSRIKLGESRAMIRAALNGSLDKVEYHKDPVFGLMIPGHCPGVDPGILNPRNTWAEPEAYDRQARDLAGRFAENFRNYQNLVATEISAAGPVS
ncbi:phosphoenolpyruvate carboxykinase (ATP) [Niabella drilacis]|uniref:Phosphoenolpyruvate carboxykinase (ATP) n=1 Tax=Niabella drilacis (strain DSM 25811 / CCM 8410 / CCUG 62505 / LMG 26954 / E90) TaxID=1285928 RepID=A0A1G6IJP1_NIADE|nr:phosphoenolpyruvate carboxykinase (ATP) [Niabella drilacis]SDC06737.1 phosphoenolpyruvate carboxykinase (ATP) [Niabella drilacis]